MKRNFRDSPCQKWGWEEARMTATFKGLTFSIYQLNKLLQVTLFPSASVSVSERQAQLYLPGRIVVRINWGSGVLSIECSPSHVIITSIYWTHCNVTKCFTCTYLDLTHEVRTAIILIPQLRKLRHSDGNLPKVAQLIRDKGGIWTQAHRFQRLCA